MEIEPVWIYPKVQTEWKEAIINEFNIHPVTAQVLVSRGFESFEDIYNYLYAKLPNLHDPFLFVDMKKAVSRICVALKKKENILIYGDNDVDGITGTTLLVDFIQKIGGSAFYYVPNRNTLEKSVVLDALEYAKRKECSLLITVDCGITAVSEIEEVVRNKVDVIVTDHHEPTDQIPHCIATLNPKLVRSTYPNRGLTGVGVAFKLAHAVTNHLVSLGEMSVSQIDLKRFLDLVALGTVADMGPLRDENRILVRYGLRQFAKSKRIGLLKLLDVCEVKPSMISTADIASKIAPRLNSLGRIADPRKGVELLLLQESHRAEQLARELDLNNTERQKIERKDTEDVENYILQHPEMLKERALVLHSNEWHPGIIPIISARIAKQYNRPTAIIAIENGKGKGSLRTIPEFPLLPPLKDLSDLLLDFGGHDYAAGLLIDEANIETFAKRFIDKANHGLVKNDVLPKVHLDSPIEFRELTFEFLESMSLLEPFGMENPAPILYSTVTQT